MVRQLEDCVILDHNDSEESYAPPIAQMRGGLVVREEDIREASNHFHMNANWAERLPEEDLSPTQLMLCPSFVRCFSTKTQNWYKISLKNLRDVQWTENAMESLVLEKEKKDLVRKLVEQHVTRSERTNMDVIRGKGEVCWESSNLA